MKNKNPIPTTPAHCSMEEITPSWVALLPAVVFRLNADGKLVWINDEWERLSGQPAAEAVGDGWQLAAHPDDIRRLDDDWLEVVARWKADPSLPRTLSCTYRLLKGDGGFVLVSDRISAVEDSARNIIGFAGLIIPLETAGRCDYAPVRASLKALTKRESELASFMVAGLTNREAAERMGISVRTAEAHRASLMEKLNISSVAELVRLMVSGTGTRKRRLARK